MVIEVFIEGEKLDLYNNETISITQGVQDVKDISKIFADFSQSFNVPASKRNNIIFKNYSNQDIDNGFDARTRKDGIININTLPFKTGKIQLNGVKEVNGEPVSYDITFYGDVIKVKDLIGDDKLNTLTWLDNFNSDYNSANVLTGLTTGIDKTVDGVLYEKAIVYPLISYVRQYLYNSNAADTTSTETLVNINYNASRSDGIAFENLKPAIKLYLIVEAIEQKYGINFVGGFFESTLFKDIYVNLNKETETLANGYLEYENVNLTNVNLNFPGDRIVYGTTITPRAGFETVPYRIVLKINGTAIKSTGYLTGTKNRVGILENVPNNANATAEIITQVDFEFDAATEIKYEVVLPFGGTTSTTLHTATYLNQVINLELVVLNEIKDIKTYDFLVGLFKTFNLVVSPLNGDILVEDLPTWYTQGEIIDITPYIDTSKKGVDKGVIFNKIDFKFQESEQILADEFFQSNDRVYGNEQLTLYTDATETEKLDGKTLEVESVFENPIFERLTDLDDGSDTLIQYCPYFDREINTISKNPFMFYVNQVDISTNTLGYKALGVYSEINTTVMMPTHAQQIDFDSFSLNFASEINEYTRNLSTDTIYSRFYSDYISDVFSIKRRNFKFTGILPLSILNSLKLNDRLVIENTRYLINSITSNLTNREDNLELINDIYDAPLATDILNTSLFTPNLLRYGSGEVTDSTQYIGKINMSTKKKDTGYGTSWVTVDSFGSGSASTLTYTLDPNLTGLVRTVIIEVIDGLKDPQFYIVQEP